MTRGADIIAAIILLALAIAIVVYLLHWLYRRSSKEVSFVRTGMLDNGVTLDSTTVVQNCEWSGSSHQCGQAQSGRDTFKTTVKILD